MFKHVKMAIIGLGYVGLPLAIEFSKKQNVIGFDTNKKRISELKNNVDSTLEVEKNKLNSAKNIIFTNDIEALDSCNVYIVTVPTPIDKNNAPDLDPLLKASALLASVIEKGDIVIFESTVYPGATEEVCIPVIEKGSG
jgi:UDP-N-acetyl-D-galactosamine dehydrogenase